MNHDLQFYSALPSDTRSLVALLKDEQSFVSLPESWDIVITDVADSTMAVAEGKYREVNLTAVSCIVAAQNIARTHSIQIPFLFGGDGATLMCPASITSELVQAFEIIVHNARKNFGFVLRVGSINATRIFEMQGSIKLAKTMIAPGYDQILCIGNGLALAEKIIKNEYTEKEGRDKGSGNTDIFLKGLQCRFREIAAPHNNGEILSLVITAKEHAPQARLYAEILEIIESLYGSNDTRHPVTKQHLSIATAYKDSARELKMRYEKPSIPMLVSHMLRVFIASLIFKCNIATKLFDPTIYKQQLIAATDNLKIDGSLKTTIHGLPAQREKLIHALNAREQKGVLNFGYYSTDATVMTCYVYDRSSGHIHFLDAKGGGYTQAAAMLKQKIRASETL